MGADIAEIKALLQRANELLDTPRQAHPNPHLSEVVAGGPALQAGEAAQAMPAPRTVRHILVVL
jgi:hypothetical protein